MSYHKNTIYETVIQCHYNKDYHNHITNIINYVNEKKFNNFRIQKLNVQGKFWIGLFLEILTLYNIQKFFIPIQILIPDNFPYLAPIVSVCLPPNTILNSENKDIDQKTCRISTNLLNKWDCSTNLNKIIEEISQSFNKNFPILQIQPCQSPNMNVKLQPDINRQSPQINPCQSPNMTQYYNPNSSQGFKKEIKEEYFDEKFNSSKDSTKSLSENNVNVNWDKFSISSESTNYTQNTAFSDNQNMNQIKPITPNQDFNNINRNPQYNQINNNNVFSPQQHPQNFNPFQNYGVGNQQHNVEELKAQTKAEIINHIRSKVDKRFIEENLYQKDTNYYLENAKLHLNYRAEKLARNLENSDEVLFHIQEESNKIQKEVEDLKNHLIEKSSKKIDKQNCFDFIAKDDKFDIIAKVICSQATIEDILIYIKKGFEKGVISFDETTKNIRLYSRELMKLKFIKDKILNEFKK